MKRLFYVISIVGMMILFPTLVIGQILDPELYSYDCIENENNSSIDTTYRGLYESRNGITNTLGVNVMTTELIGNQGRMTLNIENLPAGVYTYSVRCDEYVVTGKLMKK